jgi:hypothetical protein
VSAADECAHAGGDDQQRATVVNHATLAASHDIAPVNRATICAGT